MRCKQCGAPSQSLGGTCEYCGSSELGSGNSDYQQFLSSFQQNFTRATLESEKNQSFWDDSSDKGAATVVSGLYIPETRDDLARLSLFLKSQSRKAVELIEGDEDCEMALTWIAKLEEANEKFRLIERNDEFYLNMIADTEEIIRACRSELGSKAKKSKLRTFAVWAIFFIILCTMIGLEEMGIIS